MSDVVEMTRTEHQLITVYGPAVPLRSVCEVYFGLTYKEACRKAAVNTLPVPTFKLRDSERAPFLIHTSVLAQFIDATVDAAAKDWQHSQA